MYNSLRRCAGKFHLWIVCFDDLAYVVLNKLNLENVTLVSLKQFEDEALLQVKPHRTRQEYCWTCTPCTAFYVLNTEPQVDAITYLDADLMFFSSPEPIFAENQNASVLITEHRYLTEFDQSSTKGIYNVQFMMFRRNADGLQALHWWRDRCLEWCFNRVEDNRFGDQKYLDDWPERFSGVHVVQHLGAGLAPWNADQYALQQIDSKIFVKDDPLIFYHFHGLKLHPLNIGYLCGSYPISENLRKWLYKPYFHEIVNVNQELALIDSKFKSGITQFPIPPKHPVAFYNFLKSRIKEIRHGRYYKFA